MHNLFGIYFFIISSIILSANEVTYKQLQTKGFIEIKNDTFLKDNYTKLYEQYDTFIELMTTDESLFSMLAQSEKEFVSMPQQKQRYCAAPPSYRDPLLHTKKINNRIYFQYIKEHFELIKDKYASTLQQSPSLTNFFEHLHAVDAMAKKYFAHALDSFEQSCPGIKQVFYSNNNELTVVTKVVRYKRTENWHEKPHFDKCGLTLIWDNDDNHQSLMLCDNPLQPTKNNLKLPERKYAHLNDATSTLLISGLCLEMLDSKVRPTLHYVGPIQNEYRHSLISFLLIPGIDTSNMKTEFIEN